MKLGKTRAVIDHRDLLFAEFEKLRVALPDAPVGFGHYFKVGNWGMLGNDTVGDCVWAGAAHEHEMLNAMNSRPVKFTDQSVLSDYSKVTGYNPADPNTDRGTDMRNAMNYRRKTGILSADGHRHKIAGYVALEPGNWHQHLQALKIFDAVAIGIEFPQSAMYQFNAGKPWTYVKGSRIEGGHYIPLVGRPTTTSVYCVTWGKLQRMSQSFFQHYNDESYAFITQESLDNTVHRTVHRSPEGFDWASLATALALLSQASAPAPAQAT